MYPIAHLLNAALENNANVCRSAPASQRAPRTNILEGEQDYRILLDLPGVRNEDLDLSVENDTLTVKAERSLEVPEGYQSRRAEVSDKITFERSFDLGSSVDPDQVGARLEHGILTITLPKAEKNLPRRIEVQ